MTPNVFFIIASFVIVFAIFFIALLNLLKKKNPPQEDKSYQKISVDFENVMLIIDSKYSTLKDLKRAADMFFENYQKWDLSRSQKNNFLFALCLHENVNSKLILETEERLIELNPDLKKSYEKVVKKAMDMR